MSLLNHSRTWTDTDDDGLAYGPREDWTYDTGEPGSVSTAWTEDDGTDVHLTAPSGVGVSFTEPDASRVSEGLERVLAKLGVKRPSLWAAGWRRNVLLVSAGALVFGGYCLGAYTLDTSGVTSPNAGGGVVTRDPGGDPTGGVRWSVYEDQLVES